MRSKAEFRAMRESLGLTQKRMAALLGVRALDVARWELQGSPQQVPEYAWELLDDLMNRQDAAVQAALAQVDQVAKDGGRHPDEVAMPYWSGQADYMANHYLDDGGAASWAEINATSRRVAFALRDRGIAVTWVDGSQNPVPTSR